MLQNSSSASVHIRFQRRVTRDFMLQAGKNVVQLPAGSYTYQYKACGIQFAGKITILSGKTLRILPCKTTKIILKNYTLKEAPSKRTFGQPVF